MLRVSQACLLVQYIYEAPEDVLFHPKCIVKAPVITIQQLLHPLLTRENRGMHGCFLCCGNGTGCNSSCKDTEKCSCYSSLFIFDKRVHGIPRGIYNTERQTKGVVWPRFQSVRLHQSRECVTAVWYVLGHG